MTLTRLTLIPARKADFLFAPVSSIWRPKVVFLMTICKITMTAIQISVQIGKPSRFPCPSCLNQSISAGRSMRMISLPAQYHLASACAIMPVASVIMKPSPEPPRVSFIRSPLTRPSTSPAASATTMPTAPLPVDFSKPMQSTALSAMTWPMERSKPPTSSVIVQATASMPLTVMRRRTFRMLSMLKKLSEVSAPTMISANISSKFVLFRIQSPTEAPSSRFSTV